MSIPLLNDKKKIEAGREKKTKRKYVYLLDVPASFYNGIVE
jgi:hypothetical protein